MQTIAQRLKQARESKRLTLETAFEGTRIRVAYLQALESDDHFASGIITASRSRVPRRSATVDVETSMWVLSPALAIKNLLHAHELSADRRAGPRSLSLPGITVSARAMLDALATVGGEAARARVQMRPDPRIQAIVQTWPARFATARADSMGCVRDGDFESIVRAYAKEYVR